MISESRDDIHERMLSNIPDDHDKNIGSFMYDATRPVAIEMEKASNDRAEILEKVFPQKAANKYSEYLTMFAEAHGVPRNPGKKAAGYCTFKGTNGKEVRFNTLVETDSGLQYIVLNSGTIENGEVTLPVEAVDIGAQYNVPIGVIKFAPVTLDGVTEIINNEPIDGGVDVEDDDSLLSRIIQRMSSPQSSGNKEDYIRWAKEISGVEYVKVIPLWDGPGTVKLVVAGENGSPLSSNILQEIKEYIDPTDGLGEGKAPIGANVTITTVEQLAIDIQINNLVIGNEYSENDVKTVNIPNSINQYFSSIEPGNVVRIREVEACIINSDGVVDFETITLNSLSENIITVDEQKPVLGVVQYV